MVTQMRLTVYRTSAANLFPNGITPLSHLFQQLHNLLIVGLIVCYKYCFHLFLF